MLLERLEVETQELEFMYPSRFCGYECSNEADAVFFQQFYGVDGVIVDHVEDIKAAVDFGTKTELSPPFGRFGGK